MRVYVLIKEDYDIKIEMKIFSEQWGLVDKSFCKISLGAFVIKFLHQFVSYRHRFSL